MHHTASIAILAFAIVAAVRPAPLQVGLPPVPAPVLVPFNDGGFWMLAEPVVYEPRGIGAESAIIVPDGFVTDLTSIPAIARVKFKDMGVHGRAAIVHDYLYWSQGCSREEADAIFRLAMFESQVAWADRELIYKAVRTRGQSAWNSNRNARKAGWPKIVPKSHRKIEPLTTWAQLRQNLKLAGVAPEPSPPTKPAYCGAKLD